MNITLLRKKEQNYNSYFIIVVFKYGNNTHMIEEFKGIFNDLLRTKKFKSNL